MTVTSVKSFTKPISQKRTLLSYARVQQIASWLLRNRKIQLSFAPENNREYLNVGCGDFPHENFLNLDYHWRPGVHFCWDFAKPLPISPSSLKGIFCEHALEHIPVENAKTALQHFKNYLKKGGILRLSVPDAELFVELYWQNKNNNPKEFPYQDQLPSLTPMEHLNIPFRDHGHLFAYDFETLRKYLKQVGFEHVEKVEFRQGNDPVLLIDQEYRKCESLYLEAW